MLYINLNKYKVLSFLLILILGFMFIGSTFNNAEAVPIELENNQTLVLENLIDNGDFSDGDTGWSIASATGSVTSGVYSFTATATNGRITLVVPTVDGTSYYFKARFKTSSTNVALVAVGTTPNFINNSGSGNYEELSFIGVASGSSVTIRIQDSNSSSWTLVEVDYVMVVPMDNPVIENLTLSEFEVILADAPDYFDEWNYNYYEEDDTIVKFACERTADNLITNGDFSNGEADWSFGASITVHSVINNELNTTSKNPLNTGSNWIYQDIFNIINEDNSFYYSFYYDLVTIIDPPEYFQISSGYYNLIPSQRIEPLNSGDTDVVSGLFSLPSVRTDYFTFGVGDNNENIAIFDNIMIFDLTEMYSSGNEPTLEEWEVILDANTFGGYTSGFDYDDACYMTVTQNNPFYMYNDYDNGLEGLLDITMTDTLKDIPVTSPKITIEKYDLEMNYVGNLYSGYITDNNDDNLDGYLEHTFSYELPDPVTSEDGYIYIAYDEINENVLASGYLFKDAHDNFVNENGYNFVATNESYYGILQEPIQYEGDYTDYMFNDSNFLITHFGVDIGENDQSLIRFYSETTDQAKLINTEDPYNEFCDMDYQGAVTLSEECFYYSSSGSLLPPLINYLNSSSIAHNLYLEAVLDEYQSNYINILYNASYADNKGVYTYELTNLLGTFYGQAPVFYFDTFNDFELISHSVKEGGVLRSNLTKPFDYLDDAFDYQYLFDNNTSVYYFNIDDSVNQDIYLEVFFGLSPDDATVTYNLRRVDAYSNGAANDTYNTFISDSYVMRAIIPFEEKVDNSLEVIGMNDTAGRIIIAAIVMVFVTILVYFVSRNPLITLIADFLAFALLMVLGIVPTWIMLFLLVILLVSIFLKRKGD